MKKFAIALALVATMFSAAPKAEAFGIVNIIATGRLDYVGMPRTQADMILTVACIALLPLCILDEQAGGNTVSAQYLLENGYSADQVAAIVEGQNALTSHLEKNGLQITREGNMSKEELASFVLSVPGTNAEFANFMINN